MSRRSLALVACVPLLGCSDDNRPAESGTTTTFGTTTSGGSETATDTGTEDGTGDATGDTGDESSEEDESDTLDPPDFPPVASGCTAVDVLFVIDNSESMETYQTALIQEFPNFVDAMWEQLPEAVSVHVGITTTDFDTGCDAPEATMNCQTTSPPEDVLDHYIKPTVMNDGGNGAQGRLFRFNNMRYFETTTDNSSDELKTWFSGAAVAAGEDGCSFEMPVAAAGWSVDPINTEDIDDANHGFLRDAGALLVVFFLTDEPDKSPESVNSVYKQQILDAKAECGGADMETEKCIYVSGLVPECVEDVNQKLWQFMNAFSEEEPVWGDILDTANYANVVGAVLAEGVAAACEDVPPVG